MALHDMLTRREWEVYELLFQGKSFKEIGDKLSIAEGTTDQHVRHILAKLGLKSRPQAQFYAVTHGLFPEIVEMHVAREQREGYSTGTSKGAKA